MSLFNAYFNLSGVVDGTKIRIDPPSSNKDDYIDRKGMISALYCI